MDSVPSRREANQRVSQEQPKQPIASRDTKCVTSVRTGRIGEYRHDPNPTPDVSHVNEDPSSERNL